MTEHSGDILHYLPRSSRDELWGVVCTTAGHQHVPPGTDYPVSRHPAGYHFSKGKGRVLDEFQLVYITAGRGRFESASCPPTVVEAGSMLLLSRTNGMPIHPIRRSGGTSGGSGSTVRISNVWSKTDSYPAANPFSGSDGAAESSAVTGRSSRRSRRSGWVSSP